MCSGSSEDQPPSAYYISMILISRLSESYLIDSRHNTRHGAHNGNRSTGQGRFQILSAYITTAAMLLAASSREMSQILITKIISLKCLLSSLSSVRSPQSRSVTRELGSQLCGKV